MRGRLRPRSLSRVKNGASYDRECVMTNLLNSIASRPGWQAEPHERMIAIARGVLLWERVWPALWPATGVVGLYIAAALFGLIGFLPGALRSLLLLFVLSGAAFLLLREFRQVRIPDWNDAARRVERDSRLANRPITERADRLLAGEGDAMAESLWRAHVVQVLRGISLLRVTLPSPGLARKDPYVLRYFILLVLLGGFLFASADWQRRLASAFTIDEGTNTPVASVDAWITPPAYTGWAPIYLRPTRVLGKSIAVPSGSVLVLRVHGGHTAPHLQMNPRAAKAYPDFTGQSGTFGASASISAGAQTSRRTAGRL